MKTRREENEEREAIARRTRFEDITRRYLGIHTLQERGSDSLDFHDVGVFGVRCALEEAFELGREEMRKQILAELLAETTPTVAVRAHEEADRIKIRRRPSLDPPRELVEAKKEDRKHFVQEYCENATDDDFEDVTEADHAAAMRKARGGRRWRETPRFPGGQMRGENRNP